VRRSSKRRYRPAAEPLSRPQQIAEALTLLDPREQHRNRELEADERRRLVEDVLDTVDRRVTLEASLKGPASKQGKLEIRRHRNALARSQMTYRRLGRANKRWFSLQAADTQENVTAREIAVANDLLKWSARPSGGKDSSRARAAARLAHRLLERFGFKHITITRGKAYHRLSAVLFGDRNADLYEHMRAYVHGLRQELGKK
jgi:hypothetical protein